MWHSVLPQVFRMPTEAVLMKSRLTLNFCETMCLAWEIRVTVWAGFGIRFEVRVSFRVNYFKESFSVLLCATESLHVGHSAP